MCCHPGRPDGPVQITVCEVSFHAEDSSFTAEVTGTAPDSQPAPVRVRSPFSSAAEEQELQWYCETADREPFSVFPRLQRVEQAMRDYGTDLFRQVFSHPHTELPTDRVITVRIVGSARFCGLHWELLRDPARGPVALDPMRCLVRAAPSRPIPDVLPHRLASYPTLNVLFLTARQRIDEKDIPLRIESLAVMNSVRDHDLPLRFDLVRPGTITALMEKLEQVKPGFYHILHLDCHGASGDYGFGDPFDMESNRLVLETERASYTTVSACEIAEIVDMFEIPIVITSACRSGMNSRGAPSFAYELFSRSNVQCVVAMALSVLVDTTARFVREFYHAMTDPHGKRTVRAATRSARRTMSTNLKRRGVMGTIERQDWWLPQLFERSLPCPSQTGHFSRCSWEDAALQADSPEEKELIWEDSELTVKRKNLLITEAVDDKTFLGRNEDLRLLECKVFSHDRADNVILLYGMMGCGKTAFLTYVSWWWCVTGLVRDKFVFRLHERTFNLNDMIWHIQRQIFNVQNYDPTSASVAKLEEDRRRVTEHLRNYCYVIVIDSAERLCAREGENIVGYEGLPAQYDSEYESDSEDGKFKPREASRRTRIRERIAKWLAELQGGRTIVLVGFRGSSQSDLMKYIEHKSNKLDLATIIGKYPSRLIGDLSHKWSEALVKQTLAEHGDSSDRANRSLYSYPMLDLYAGNPLVIKLMVSSFKAAREAGNTPHPEELYERLQKDMARPSASMSVMTSLEYSFNLLSASQQDALLFLAPFKGSVTEEGLRHYADALEQDPQCVNFDRKAWDSAIQMAARWGLLTRHERIRRYHRQRGWRIHACLSVLLMTKLCHKRASISHGTLSDLSSSRGYGILEQADRETVLRPMLKPMHVAYWTWALQLFDLLRCSDKAVHDSGKVMTEIDFWNLKRALRYALEEKRAFYGLVLPLYWYLAAKNDIAQRYALCRRTVEKVGIYERYDDIPAACDVYRGDIPRIYHIYGMLLGHARLHKIHEAEKWFNRTKKIWQVCGNSSEQAVTEHELGWVAMNKNQYAKARKHYTKALELSDRLEGARTLHNMGLLAARERDYENAMKFHDEAKTLYEEQGDDRAVASAYHHMAIDAMRIGAYEKAEEYAKKSSSTRKEREDTKHAANAYQLRGNIAQRRARKRGISAEETAKYLAVAKKKYDKAMVFYNIDNGYHYGVIPEREMLHENYGLLVATRRRFSSTSEQSKELLRTEMDSYLRVTDGLFPKAIYNIGLVCEELGQHQDAYSYFCRAADISSDYVKGTVEWEACRRATVAKARCLTLGRGVEKDEHEATTVMLRLKGELDRPGTAEALAILEGIEGKG